MISSGSRVSRTGSAPISSWKRRTRRSMSTVERSSLTLQALAEGVRHGVGERLAGGRGKLPCEPIGVVALDAQRHGRSLEHEASFCHSLLNGVPRPLDSGCRRRDTVERSAPEASRVMRRGIGHVLQGHASRDEHSAGKPAWPPAASDRSWRGSPRGTGATWRLVRPKCCSRADTDASAGRRGLRAGLAEARPRKRAAHRPVVRQRRGHVLPPADRQADLVERHE